MTTNAIQTTIMEQQTILERTFNVPRTFLFSMFTAPEHLTQWWNPDGWTIPSCVVDFRNGGVWRYCMRTTDGKTDIWVHAIYHHIVEFSRIVYTDTFVGPTGKKLSELPERHNTLAFTELDGKTTLTMDIIYDSRSDLKAMLDIGMIQGITQSWNHLESYIGKQRHQCN